MQRRISFLAFILVLAMIAAACGNGEEAPQTGAGDEGDEGEAPTIETVMVGYTNSLTGDLAPYGTAFQEGAELARDQVNERAEENGFRIEFVVRDDAGDPKECSTIAQEYVDTSDIVAVLGWSSSSCLLAAMPIYDQGGLPILSSGTTSPELSGGSPYFHRNTTSDAIQGEKMADYAVNELGVERVAVFNSNDDYGAGLANAFMSRAEELGAEVAIHEDYPTGTKDFRASVTKLRGADVDVIFLSGFFSEGAQVAKQAREVGVEAPFLGGEGMLAQDFIDLAGAENAEGTIVPTQYEPSVTGEEAKDFFDAFKAAYDREPGAFEALAYDAVLLLGNALTKVDEFTRESVNDALKGACATGGTGEVCLGDDGEVVRELIFLGVDNGEFVPV